MKFGCGFPRTATRDGLRPRPARGRRLLRKANDYGIDLWVIDHLLHAHGLYGMTWLEPMSVLTWAGAVHRRGARHRHPGAAAAQPGAAGEGDRDARLPVGRPLPVRRRARLVPGRVRVDRHERQGARRPHGRDPRGGRPAAHRGDVTTRGATTSSRTSPSSRGRRRCPRSGWRAARACPTPSSRRADARADRAAAHPEGRRLDLALLGQPGVGEARLGGDQGRAARAGPARRRDPLLHTNFIYLVETPSRAEGARPRRSPCSTR